MILDPGLNLTLRPMKYPELYERYENALKNHWHVSEVDLSVDVSDLRNKLMPSERHMINRLVAFFATGDTIVANNLVLNLYEHINAPEARLYLSRQLFEEAVHVQFYLTLLDTYVTDPKEREAAFTAVESIPSIKRKADFAMRWIDSLASMGPIRVDADRRRFLLNLICFACCIEGLFFFGAFAYVFFLRSKGLLGGLASGTNWVFRDESGHMAFALNVINIIRQEQPQLFDLDLETQVHEMMRDAVECEHQFAQDLLGEGVPGLSIHEMRQYLEFTADQRMANLGLAPIYKTRNPFSFIELQNVQELANFFERRPTAYQVGVEGEVGFDEEF